MTTHNSVDKLIKYQDSCLDIIQSIKGENLNKEHRVVTKIIYKVVDNDKDKSSQNKNILVANETDENKTEPKKNFNLIAGRVLT